MADGDLLRAHLIRLAAVSLVWILIAAVAWRKEDPRWRGFAVMTIVWAVIDLAIVAGSWGGSATPDGEGLRRFLRWNHVLNAGYVIVAIGMLVRARTPWWRGAGLAVLLQGLTLTVLDGWLDYLLARV